MYNCGVYQITDIKTGKFYVGSSNNLSNRKSGHFSDLRLNRHGNKQLQRIFNKKRELAFKILFFCRECDLIFYEQQAINLWNPELNEAKVAGRPDPELIRGDRNPMKREDVKVKHKLNVPRGIAHPFYGKSGDLNVMRRPDVKEKHLRNVPRGENNVFFGKHGDLNAMRRPDVKEKQCRNVPRGDLHYAKSLPSDQNVMKRPEVKEKHKRIMFELFSGSKNVIHRLEVKEKIKVTQSTLRSKRRRSLAQSNLSEETVVQIYAAKGSINEIAKAFGLSYNTVYPIKKKLSWKYLTDRMESAA